MEDNKRHKELDDLFSNLPLPDEDKAWQDMQARLEKDEDDRFIVLPPFLQGCTGWTLLLALMLGGALWLYLRNTNDNRESGSEAGQLHEERKTVAQPDTTELASSTVPQEQRSVQGLSTTTRESISEAKEQKSSSVSGPGRKQIARKAEKHTTKEQRLSEKSYVVSPAPGKKAAHKDVIAPSTETPVRDQQQDSVIDTISSPVNNPSSPADSTAAKQDTASLPQPKTVADSVQNTPPKKEEEKKKYRLAFGLALQQQLPFAGQEWTPYNYRGRKGSLADYIPSVYLRLYREPKWFLQTEFRYGAPQYTKEFVYSKETKTDTFGVRSSTSYRLKKTYYHQVPLSINFQVAPSWSIGTGLVYNRFYGAVSDREEWKGTAASPDTLVRKELVLDKNESLFRSTNVQWLLETQYHWKRWSVGGRFAQGLQPYIEYVDEQGQDQREKNRSLQLYIRYELWKSKQK